MPDLSMSDSAETCPSDTAYASDQQWCVRRIIPDLLYARGLVTDFVWRQLKGRYGNAFMGFLWAILHPLLLTIILVFVFTVVFQTGVRGNIGHSAVEILTKVVFWQYFAAAILGSMQSIIEYQNLIKKTCFPREVLPVAACINAVVNFTIGLGVVFCSHCLFIGVPKLTVLWLFLIFGMEFLLALGIGLLVSALNVRYRDVGYLAEIGLTFGFYASPVLYPLEWVGRALGNYPVLSGIYNLNPMAVYLDVCQKAVQGQATAFTPGLLWSCTLSLFLLLIGAVVFRRLSSTFADYL